MPLRVSSNNVARVSILSREFRSGVTALQNPQQICNKARSFFHATSATHRGEIIPRVYLSRTGSALLLVVLGASEMRSTF